MRSDKLRKARAKFRMDKAPDNSDDDETMKFADVNMLRGSRIEYL